MGRRTGQAWAGILSFAFAFTVEHKPDPNSLGCLARSGGTGKPCIPAGVGTPSIFQISEDTHR